MDQRKKKHDWNVHFGSMVIGFLMALCLALALGAATGDDSEGPYRISAGSDMSAFVIDTQTGHVWLVSRGDNTDLGTPLDRKSLRKSISPMVN